MVDPVSDEEREAFAWRLKLAFVALVAVSAALITLQSGAGPLGVLAATAVGVVVGFVLLRLAFPGTMDVR